MSKNRYGTLWICFCAVMAALVFALDLLAIRVGNSYKITISALPIILTAVHYGPLSASLVGLTGAFLGQLLSYGIGATTLLWILPAGVRGIVVGLLFIAFGRKLKPLCLIPAVVISSIIVTVLNVVVGYIDAYIYQYSFAVASVDIFIKLLLGITTAVILSLVTIPVIKPVSKFLNSK